MTALALPTRKLLRTPLRQIGIDANRIKRRQRLCRRPAAGPIL